MKISAELEKTIHKYIDEARPRLEYLSKGNNDMTKNEFQDDLIKVQCQYGSCVWPGAECGNMRTARKFAEAHIDNTHHDVIVVQTRKTFYNYEPA